jgi:hypothetical protein
VEVDDRNKGLESQNGIGRSIEQWSQILLTFMGIRIRMKVKSWPGSHSSENPDADPQRNPAYANFHNDY